MDSDLQILLAAGADVERSVLFLSAANRLTDELAAHLIELGGAPSALLHVVRSSDLATEVGNEWRLVARARRPLMARLRGDRELERRAHSRLLELAQSSQDESRHLPEYLATDLGVAYHAAYLDSRQSLSAYRRILESGSARERSIAAHLAMEQRDLGLLPSEAPEVAALGLLAEALGVGSREQAGQLAFSAETGSSPTGHEILEISRLEVKSSRQDSIRRWISNWYIERSRPKWRELLLDDVWAGLSLVTRPGWVTGDYRLIEAQQALRRAKAQAVLGNLDDAFAGYSRLWERYRNERDPALRALGAAASVGWADELSGTGQTAEALALCLAVYRENAADDDPAVKRVVARALLTAGSTCVRQGSSVAVPLSLYEEVARRYGTDRSPALRAAVASALVQAGLALGEGGDRRSEWVVYGRVIEEFSDDRDAAVRVQRARAFVCLGLSHAEAGQSDEAAALLKTVTTTYGRDDDLHVRAYVESARQLMGKSRESSSWRWMLGPGRIERG